MVSVAARTMLRGQLVRPAVMNQKRGLRLIPRMPKMPTFESFKLKNDPPGNIVGTVNDAYVPPEYCPPEGSFHWAYERIVTVSMVPLMAFPFVGGVEYPIVDALMSTLVLAHCRYGIQSCIVDYIPLRRFQGWHKLALALLNVGTGVSMYGIYKLETEDNGAWDLVIKLWG